MLGEINDSEISKKEKNDEELDLILQYRRMFCNYWEKLVDIEAYWL